MGIVSNLINRNVPDFKLVIKWTQTRLELTCELSVKRVCSTNQECERIMGKRDN